MAIFNKTDKSANYASNVTTIADGCKFDGKVELLCTLHIDGEFTGEISSTSHITIGKTGFVKSDLKAEKLVVAGRFVGSAECDIIELVAGGDVKGKLTSASLSMDSGSAFRGESIRKSPNSSSVVGFRKTTSADKTIPGQQKEDKAPATTTKIG